MKDDIRVCETPVATKDEQAEAWGQVKRYVDRQVGAEEVQAYVDMLSYWHPWEVLPALGAGLVAPFTPVLRSNNILVPHLLHWSPESDLGKSLTAMMASTRMFTIDTVSGGAIDSPFRLAAHLDSVCLAIVVEEADRLKPTLWPSLKDSAERWLVSKRGKQNLEMNEYHSRAVLIFTGNSMNITAEGILKRFIIVRFDSAARIPRRVRAAEVRNKFNALRPIGFQLVRWAAERWGTEEALLGAVRMWEGEIDKARSSWESPMRPQAWSCIYLGLRILEEGCQRVGVAWEAPSIARFVEEVVSPIEDAAWSLKRTNASRFAAWFSMWRVRNTKTVRVPIQEEKDRTEYVNEDRIQGKDEIFKEGTVGEGTGKVAGFWVTDSLLDLFNKEVQDAVIPSLAELAKQAADEFGLLYEDVLDADKVHARGVWIGTRSRRAAFVPDVEPPKEPATVQSGVD